METTYADIVFMLLDSGMYKVHKNRSGTAGYYVNNATVANYMNKSDVKVSVVTERMIVIQTNFKLEGEMTNDLS